MTKALLATARGVYIISATPFTEDGVLDLGSLDRLIDFYLEHNVHGITVLGMMGEAHKLTQDESAAFLERVFVRAPADVPVVVGVSSSGLKPLATLARRAMDLGAAGVMVAPPAGLATDETVYNYFEAVCTELGEDIPLVIQDFPLANGVQFSVPLLVRLIDALPSFIVLKHEDWPGLVKLSRIRAEADGQRHRRISILTGNGGLFLPQELARGADGAMTGFAYPEMLVEVCKRFAAGEREGAEDLFDAYLPLVRHEQQRDFGLAVRKYVLFKRGVIATPATRKPGVQLNAQSQAEVDALVTRLERRLVELQP